MTGIRVCPNCGSERVERDRQDIISSLGLDVQYRCAACGYAGKLFPEVPEENIEEYLEEVEDHEAAEVQQYTGFDRSRLVMGAMLLLLGAGSLPLARVSLHGVIGALLIPVGAQMIYKEYRRFRGTP